MRLDWKEACSMSSTRAQTGTQVQLPKLGESVTEGTIGAWLKQVGDRVEKYDPLVEITTDKVNAEVPSPLSGVLIEITAQEGETLPVGAELCLIDESGGGAGDAVEAVEEEQREPTPAQTASEMPAASAPLPTDRERSVRHTGPDGAMELLRTRSSPAVRRIAEEHGIEIAQIRGSGIGGRVTKSDILHFVETQRTAVPETAPVVSAPATTAPPRPVQQPVVAPPRPAAIVEPTAPHSHVEVFDGDTVVPLTTMRRQIAEHMVRSERTAPHVTTWMEVDMSRVVQARTRAKERFAREEGFDLTYLAFVIKAVVHALHEHPYVNAVWDETRIIRRKAINIGVAVGLEDGLIVPVIRNADEKSIAGIARATRELTAKARDNRLSIDDVQGGTFTVNNPGTFGTILSTPLIVQPQSAILSTEAIVKRPVVIDDSIAIRSMMNLSMSIDHRVLDGLVAARFLSEVKRWLERFDPESSLY
jgi:2-oxoisovalerate dehydrogenase E2 component (dihydrolipoyl transacylase)